jgi:hypothetical protein
MKKVQFLTVVCAFFALTSALIAQGPSTRGTASTTIGGKTISIIYGRPALRGRNMLGLARTGTVWRLGMNEATEIHSELPLMAGGKHLNPGKYSLWAKKTGETTWVLAFHPMTGIFGQPELTEGFVAEVPLKMEKASQNADRLNITLTANGKNVNVDIHWGDSKLVGTFQAM